MKRKLFIIVATVMIAVLMMPMVWAAEKSETTAAEPGSEVSLAEQGIEKASEPRRAISFEGAVTFNMDAAGKPAATKTFSNGDEALGNQGLYDTGISIFKKYFVGWSDVKDYATNSEGKLYFADQKISDVYPNGLTGNETLYAVFVGGMDIFSSQEAGKADINKYIGAEDSVTGGDIADQSGFGEAYADKTLGVYYDSDTEKYQLNLNGTFTFNKQLQSLLYMNPGGILTNSGVWSDGTKENANYTHVDIHVDLDDSIDVAAMIKDISFTSYQFKPSFIMDRNYNLLADISKSLVKGSPTSVFSFDPKGNTSFIFRVTVRRDGNPDNVLNGTPEDVGRDMILTSGDLNNFTISKENALKLAESGDKVLIKGGLDGIFRAAGINRDIPQGESKELTVDFAFNQVTFDKNIGVDREGTIATVNVVHNRAIGGDELVNQSMPEPPAREAGENGEEYLFTGWNTAPDGSGTAFTDSTPVTSDLTVYAIWALRTDETQPEPTQEATPVEPTRETTPEEPANDPSAAVPTSQITKAGGVGKKQSPKTDDGSNNIVWLAALLTAGAVAWAASRKADA